jgi:hypothetical protein
MKSLPFTAVEDELFLKNTNVSSISYKVFMKYMEGVVKRKLKTKLNQLYLKNSE